MATETLAVTLLLQANQYKREAREAATATGQIGKQAQATGTATGKLDKQMSGLATTAKFAIAGVATAAVTGFVKDSIGAFSDLNESINAVNVTFGESGEGILELGEKSATAVGLSNAAFNQMAVGFSAFAENIAAAGGEDVVGIIDDLSTRIADFASVMNLDVPEAAEKFRSGLAGETEPLRKFGIDVSAARVNAKALALGLAGSSAELTEQDKVLARYHLIMEQTNKTAGDFANTSGDLANRQRILSARFEDAKAAVGAGLAPALTGLLEAVEPLVIAMGELGKITGDFIANNERLISEGNAAEGAIGALTKTLTSGALPGLINLVSKFGNLVDSSGDVVVATSDVEEHAASLSSELAILHGQVKSNAEIAKSLAVPSAEALAHAMERAGKAAKFQREQMVKTRDELRNIHDPLFRVVSLNSDLAEAEDAVTEASKKGITSPEYRDAVLDRARIFADLEGTLIDLKNQGIDPTGAAARLMLEGLGIPPNVIDDMFAQFDALQADFEGRTFRGRFSFPNVRFGDTGEPVRVGDKIFRQHGGPVTARQAYIVGEAGPELFIPNHSGTVIPNSQGISTGSPVGGSQTLNVFTLTWGDFVRKAADAGLEIQRYGW